MGFEPQSTSIPVLESTPGIASYALLSGIIESPEDVKGDEETLRI